jgi:hypothetical protein
LYLLLLVLPRCDRGLSVVHAAAVGQSLAPDELKGKS